MKKRKSMRIEKTPIGYEVIKDRGDGVAFSVGSAKTKREAVSIKKKNRWGD